MICAGPKFARQSRRARRKARQRARRIPVSPMCSIFQTPSPVRLSTPRRWSTLGQKRQLFDYDVISDDKGRKSPNETVCSNKLKKTQSLYQADENEILQQSIPYAAASKSEFKIVDVFRNLKTLS